MRGLCDEVRPLTFHASRIASKEHTMTSHSSRSLQFIQVDVFTDRVFGGNPLAVFLDGAGVSDEEMQAIAREMNLSETVFLLPPSQPQHTARARIFTPAREIPFAGHPTIGTAWVLA